MRLYRIESQDEFLNHMNNYKHDLQIMKKNVNEIEISKRESLPGYSYTAKREVEFEIRYNNKGSVNWREGIRCPVTGFNNRTRLVTHIGDLFLEFYENNKIYITEQKTDFFRFLKNKYEREYRVKVIGSEFLGTKYNSGDVVGSIRNEDLTKLSFDDMSIDTILSFDVFEHIPDYKRAIGECFRVLQKNGKMLITVPFIQSNLESLVRAELNSDGEIKYIEEPEYHGDPINNQGILCFYHFGWEFLNDISAAGFSKVYAVLTHSREFGYLGRNEQMVIIAEK